MTRGRALALILLLLLLGAGEAFAQCAMCRSALESPEGRELAAGFRRGILVLLAAPITAVGTIGFLVVRARRRVKV